MTIDEKIDRLGFVLGEIARGRFDCGRPLAAETSRQMSRDVLLYCDMTWPTTTRPAQTAGERS